MTTRKTWGAGRWRAAVGGAMVVAAMAGAAPAGADAYNLKVVTDATPDYSDLGSMIHSITANWPETNDKCWALFYWNHIARRQTQPMVLHGRALTDPIRQFNDYGYTMCSTVSGVNCGIWGAMGLGVKYWDISMHTVPEVEYGGRFHMIDNSMSALYTLCDGRTLAGVEDIGAEGSCPASGGRIEPGHVARYHCLNATGANGYLTGADCARPLADEYRCFNPNGLKYRYYLNDWDLGHRFSLNLRNGESYVRYYHRLDEDSPGAVPQGDKASKYKADSAYFVPNEEGGRDPESVNPRYHIRGNGVREWSPGADRPPPGPEGCAYRLIGARVSEDKKVVPIEAGKPGEIVYKVEGANVVTSLAINAGFHRKTADDLAAIALSTTNGLAWKEVWRADKLGEVPAEIGLIGPVNGAYEVLVRVTLMGKAAPADARLDRIHFRTITQLNTKTLPRLRLGKNMVYVGKGPQTESIVVWPNLKDASYRQYVVEEKNIRLPEKQQEYLAYLCAEKGGEDAYLVFRIDAPRDLRSVTYGGRFYNRAPKSHIDLLHSFDGGKTWTRSYTLSETSPPWDVIHYETIRDIPSGTRSVLMKYVLSSPYAGPDACGLYAVRMEARHGVAECAAQPLYVTFTWRERQAESTLIQRSHTQYVEKLPCVYDINVGGADHPVMESLKIGDLSSVAGVNPGYSDQQDLRGARKFQDRWVTYGKNLAEGKPYTCTVPTHDGWGANDGGGRILTDGVVGSPYSGGVSYRDGMLWQEREKPVVTVDLGKPEHCAAFRIHVGGYPFWDALKGEIKDRVEVFTSLDGKEYASQGTFAFNRRWKDLPANEMWPDDETMTAVNGLLAASKPVEARYVRFVIAPARMLSVSEVQVLDSYREAPFDLKLAMPDGKDRSDLSRYNPPHNSYGPREARKKAASSAFAPRTATLVSAPIVAKGPAVPDASRPGEVTPEVPTLRCLGVRWLVGGDGNANARIATAYRKAGTTAWKPALDLFRVETAGMREAVRPPAGQTLFAGSFFGLEENTDYEVALSLTDPDGGDARRVVRMTTWSEPRLASSAPSVDVRPGQLADALAKAKPGQVLKLHQGRYQGTFQPRSGEPGRPIGIVAAGDGEAILDGQGAANVINAPGLHDVIFERLTFQNATWAVAVNGGHDLVMRRCTIRDAEYGFVATRNAQKQRHILLADNEIVGRSHWPRTQGIEDRRGVQLSGSGNVVCYNRVRAFGDAIDTFPGGECSAIDFYGNEISECTDDGIEMDYSEHNTRCFDNRLTNVFQGISVQPVYGGPAYVFRNAIYNVGMETFKMHNRPSGAIFYHNTSVKSGMPLVLYTHEPVVHCVSRNNLFLGTSAGYGLESTAPMTDCDFDYDGFGGTWTNFLKWNGARCATMAEAGRKAGVYGHAVRVTPATAFASGLQPPPSVDKQFSPQENDLRPSPGSEAVDAGLVLPNVNDGYQGKAPDLGAYERGRPLPHYGPRP